MANRKESSAVSYAEAIFQTAHRHACYERVAGELQTFEALLAGDPRLRAFWLSPRIDVRAKGGVLRRTLGGRFHGLTVRFLELLVQKGRAALLGKIRKALGDLEDRAAGRARGTFASATGVEEAAVGRAARAIQPFVERTVALERAVRPELLGGYRIRVGDVVVDASLRRKVEAFRRQVI